DIHKCSDRKPSVNSIDFSDGSITVSVSRGTHQLSQIEVLVNGRAVATRSITGSGIQRFSHQAGTGKQTITVRLQDEAYYQSEGSRSFTVSSDDSDED